MSTNFAQQTLSTATQEKAQPRTDVERQLGLSVLGMPPVPASHGHSYETSTTSVRENAASAITTDKSYTEFIALRNEAGNLLQIAETAVDAMKNNAILLAKTGAHWRYERNAAETASDQADVKAAIKMVQLAVGVDPNSQEFKDGIYGDQTTALVTAYQRRKQLENPKIIVDGKAGRQVIGAILADLSLAGEAREMAPEVRVAASNPTVSNPTVSNPIVSSPIVSNPTGIRIPVPDPITEPARYYGRETVAPTESRESSLSSGLFDLPMK